MGRKTCEFVRQCFIVQRPLGDMNNGVRIGTPDNSKKTIGNVFEDLVIKNNRLLTEANAPQSSQMIFANATATAGIIFNGLVVSGNRI